MKKHLSHVTIEPPSKMPLLLLGAIISCLASGRSSAEQLSVDLFAPGDHLVTRDTATGLDWLDLTATLNLSARDILADAGGWRSLGFVHASTMDVRTLFLNSDPPNIVINTGENPLSPSNVTGAQRLLNLMGITHSGPSPNEFDIFGNGITGIGEPEPGQVHFADYGTTTDGTLGFFFVPDGTAPDTFRDPQVGNFLIRQVPEPAAVWLLGLAAVLLPLFRKQLNARSTHG